MKLESQTNEETCSAALLAQSGSFVSSGSGMTPTTDGLIAVVIAAVFGGFCGVMGGFIIWHLSRFVSFMTGRQLWGSRWVLIGAVVGALAFGIKAWLDNRD